MRDYAPKRHYVYPLSVTFKWLKWGEEREPQRDTSSLEIWPEAPEPS